MKRLLILAALALATPAFAGDLVYRRAPEEGAALKPWDGQAWWRLFAACSGYQAAVYDDARATRDGGRANDAKEGVALYQGLAVDRLKVDEGLSESDAMRRVGEIAEAARRDAAGEIKAKGALAGAELALRCSALEIAYAKVK